MVFNYQLEPMDEKTSTIHKTDKAEIVISASSLNQTTSKFYLTFYGITPPYQRELKSDMIKKLPNILFMYSLKSVGGTKQ